MKTVVLLPTFNEAANIARVIEGLRFLRDERLGLPPDILVADDDSPDGTWRVVSEIGRRDPAVRVLRRERDKGRGLAGREGFLACLHEMGAEVVVEMDADGSHPVEDIPRMIAGLFDGNGADLVVGSRRVDGGGEEGRGLHRRILTLFSHAILRLLLGTDVRDPTSGLRVYRRAALERIDPARMGSVGPEIVEEVIWRAERAGLRIREVPFVFRERWAGKSNLTPRRLLGVFLAVIRLRVRGAL